MNKFVDKLKDLLHGRKKEIIIAVIVLVLLLGISYAWIRKTITSSNKNVLVAGKLRLEILNEDPIIKAGGEGGYAIPTEDSVGLQTKPYTFTIKNTGNIDTSFEITLIDASSYIETYTQTDEYGSGYGYGSTSVSTAERQIAYSSQRIPDSLIRFNLAEGSYYGNNSVSTLSSVNRLLLSGTLAPGETKTYQLRLWIDINATISDIDGKVFAANLSINATQSGGRAQDSSSTLSDGTYYMPHGTVTTLGSPLPSGIVAYNSVWDAPGLMAIKNVIEDGVVTETYLEFVYSGDTYTLKGGPGSANVNMNYINPIWSGNGKSSSNGSTSSIFRTTVGHTLTIYYYGSDNDKVSLTYAGYSCVITPAGVASCEAGSGY